MRVLHGDDVRRAGPVVDERQFSEMVAHAQHTKDDLPAILTDQNDFDPPMPDNEQRIAGIVLEQNDASARVKLLASEISESL